MNPIFAGAIILLFMALISLPLLVLLVGFLIAQSLGELIVYMKDRFQKKGDQKNENQ
jgi:hypothetical protein